MLGHVNTQLAQLQRDEIKPSLKAEYTAICSAEVPITSQYLFGGDLAKQLRDAKEASKISHSFASSSKNGPFKGKQQTSNHHDHYSKGPKRDFLWRGQNRHYKKKNRQTSTRNDGTTASNKEQGNCFWRFPAQPGELFTNVMPYI